MDWPILSTGKTGKARCTLMKLPQAEGGGRVAFSFTECKQIVTSFWVKRENKTTGLRHKGKGFGSAIKYLECMQKVSAQI